MVSAEICYANQMEKSIKLSQNGLPHWARSVWMGFGRISLLLIYLTCLLLTLASIVPRFRWLTQPYAGEQFDYLRLTTRYLPQLGISPTAYAVVAIIIEILLIGIPMVIAAIIFIRSPHNLYAQFCAVVFVANSFTANYAIDAIKFDYPPLITIESVLQAWAIVGYSTFLYTFPSGKLVPRWSWIMIGWQTALLTYFLIYPETPGNYLQAEFAWQAPLFIIIEATILFSFSVGAQLYRYFRASNAVERQQTKWLVYGIAVSYSAWGVRSAVSGLSNLDSAAVVFVIWVCSLLALTLPLAFAIAITRYRLWEIDLVISLTFVYTSLILVIVGVYLGSIAAFQRMLGTQSPLANALALVVAALLFQPVRDRLQRTATRYLYGDRDDPARVLGELGRRLETVGDSAEILPSVVDTITRSLRVPYAALALREGDSYRIAAQQGTVSDHLLTLPLIYQGKTVGEMRVGQRTSADPFDERDENLLKTLARQAGTAVHTVQLTRDLQRSRLNLVTAREEERRRLRRDLHDGLGPTLAAQIFRVGAIRNNLYKNPAKSDELLAGLEAAIDSTLADVRRLIYALRPPLLDQLGLLGAIDNHISTLDVSFDITQTLPDTLPLLNAAVEVAAFRICQTALDNVAQHAQASQCDVRVWVEATELCISIVDDGVGIGQYALNGVGLTSMRERAEELGGTFAIATVQPHGTRVYAAIPIEMRGDQKFSTL